MKNVLLYFALVILVFLLLLPPGLRLFGRNLYSERNIKKQDNTLEILDCNKINESISTSFVNGKAYNIKYTISGNHVPEKEISDEENPDEGIVDINKNNIIEDLKGYAESIYLEEKNITEFRVDLNMIDSIPLELQNYTKSIGEMSSFYGELSFSCTSQKY